MRFPVNILFIIITGALLLCCGKRKTYKGEFINRERWGGGIYRFPVNKPVEIREMTWNNLDDTTLDASGRLYKINVRGYDSAGNTIYRRSFYDDQKGSTSYSETEITYDEDGLQEITYRYTDSSKEKKIGTERITTRKIADYTFRKTNTGYGTEETIVFSPDGRRQRVEVRRNGKLANVFVQFFQNGKMKWMDYEDHIGTARMHIDYYYSSKGDWDSTIIRGDAVYPVTKGKLNMDSKDFALNNEYGDPLYEWNGSGHYGKYSRYKYDAKGNWIKALVYLPSYNHNDSLWGPLKNPKYELITREIKY
jgi:hypothetical protein